MGNRVALTVITRTRECIDGTKPTIYNTQWKIHLVIFRPSSLNYYETSLLT